MALLALLATKNLSIYLSIQNAKNFNYSVMRRNKNNFYTLSFQQNKPIPEYMCIDVLENITNQWHFSWQNVQHECVINNVNIDLSDEHIKSSIQISRVIYMGNTTVPYGAYPIESTPWRWLAFALQIF